MMNLAPPSTGSLTLLCLPHAGGRASAYRGWADELPSSLHPVALDYPRGAADSVAAIAERVAVSLAAWPRSQPLALFGHSLGALVAYELALRLHQAHRGPQLLLVSGHRAPQEPPREAPAHLLPSPQLQAWLRRWGGVPRALRDDPAILAAFEPALREDLRLAETWVAPPPAPLACPVVAIAGLDDSLAPPPAMGGWRDVTRGSFRQHALPGSHFYLFEQRQQFLALLALEIERC
jgi:surfactin synthase thioesterase subunit